MKKSHTAGILAAALSTALLLTACSSNTTTTSTSSPTAPTTMNNNAMDHSMPMDHPMDGGAVPTGMVPAENPTYPIGSTVTLTTDHMMGMNGARATVVGAYKTNTYAVNYTPTNGGDPIKNHKWVVQEEIKDAGTQRLANGAEVTLTADHMMGMNGARATIASSTDETVYVVDYEVNGQKMTNHKWVVESEMKPAE